MNEMRRQTAADECTPAPLEATEASERTAEGRFEEPQHGIDLSLDGVDGYSGYAQG